MKKPEAGSGKKNEPGSKIKELMEQKDMRIKALKKILAHFEKSKSKPDK